MNKQEFVSGMRVQYDVAGGPLPAMRFAGLEGTVISGNGAHTVTVRWDNDVTQNHSTRYIRPVVDDFLPPAPDSAMYFCSNASQGNDQRLSALPSRDLTNASGVFIGVKLRTGCQYEENVHGRRGVGIHLSPDDTLQLAHDLIRMAMQLKREQGK